MLEKTTADNKIDSDKLELLRKRKESAPEQFPLYRDLLAARQNLAVAQKEAQRCQEAVNYLEKTWALLGQAPRQETGSEIAKTGATPVPLVDVQVLQHGCRVLARCGRAGQDNVDWEPVCEYTLDIDRRSRDGRFAGLSIQNREFAEFDGSQYEGKGLFIAEDYYFEIQGILHNPEPSFEPSKRVTRNRP